MRFTPSPLTEASLVAGIAWILALLLSVITSGFNFNLALSSAMAIAQLFMLISFTLWAVLGLFVRYRASAIRLLVNLSATSVISVAGTLLLLGLTQQQIMANPDNFSQAEAGLAQAKVASLGIVFFVSATAAALVTFLFVTAPKRTK